MVSKGRAIYDPWTIKRGFLRIAGDDKQFAYRSKFLQGSNKATRPQGTNVLYAGDRQTTTSLIRLPGCCRFPSNAGYMSETEVPRGWGPPPWKLRYDDSIRSTGLSPRPSNARVPGFPDLGGKYLFITSGSRTSRHHTYEGTR